MSEIFYSIRLATPADEPFLWEMLYYAASMAEDGAESGEAAKAHPFLAEFVREWGRPGDLGVIAVDSTDRKPLGAAWLRPASGAQQHYLAVAPDVPELAIAVVPSAVGLGIGTALLARLLDHARQIYPAVALSVREYNPARRLYERFGFTAVDEIVNRVGGRSFVMLKVFSDRTTA